MTSKRDRVFALTMALTFLVTASFLTIAVIYSAIAEKDKQDPTTQMNPNSLAGTKLKDFTPIASITELQKTDTKLGTGVEAKADDAVSVDYTGAVAATGVIFQSSLDSGDPISFSLSGVIQGWSEGVPGMKEGGTRRLLVPAALAYGPNPPDGSGIPPNADLVFDITLHKVGE